MGIRLLPAAGAAPCRAQVAPCRAQVAPCRAAGAAPCRAQVLDGGARGLLPRAARQGGEGGPAAALLRVVYRQAP
eukprot:4563775-Prymnesium_polylepis.1